MTNTYGLGADLFVPAGSATDWQENSLCSQADPEAFFPEQGASSRDAKKLCLSCSVRDECLQYAIDHDERFGIWGGLTEKERRKIKSASPAGQTARSGHAA